MTARALAARRSAGLLTSAAFAAAAVLATLVIILPAREPANAATVMLPPARAASLIDATTGAGANRMQAIGEQAKLINAALPFAGGPLHSARPFAATGSDVDQGRALLCLTQAVYYEAGMEPLDGRRAVAQVVLNRMRHPAFPKSICGVVYQGAGTRVCQFTFVCDGALYRAPALGAWRQAEQVARAALAGFVAAPVGAATHYHADYVAPRWAPLLAKVAQIGQHIFYRWPGSWGQPAAFSGRYIGEPRDPLAMRPPRPAAMPAAPGELPSEIAQAGPPMPRAETDVGGLLDLSKGWTLRIPGPEESGRTAATIAAAHERKLAAPVQAAAEPTAGPAVASR